GRIAVPGSASCVPPEARTTAARSIAKLIAWGPRTSEHRPGVVLRLMDGRQDAGASTPCSEPRGSRRRGSGAAGRVPEVAVGAAPRPAIIRGSVVDWSRPASDAHAAGDAFRTSSVAGSQFSLRTREMELPGV